jgi:hypothetical protein
MSRWSHVGATLFLLSFAACSGGGAESAAADAAAGKQLKDLTADDAQAECQAIATQVALSREDTCEFAGLMSTAFGQSCETVKSQCLSATQGQPTLEVDGSCLPPTERRAGCSASIAEFRVCLIAQAEAVRALDCSSSLSALSTLPQACEEVSRKCPRLFTADEGGAQPGGDQGSADPGDGQGGAGDQGTPSP